MAPDAPEPTPHTDAADKIAETQSQTDALKTKPRANEGDMSNTVVVGGLQRLGSLFIQTRARKMFLSGRRWPASR